ncbi:MAG: nucleotidyltransferase [Chlamydiae bacterium]|nr:nucleotidyltransferase [Chlamydiota bacterium]MBI3276939.1 nucleotidyltransferase [Chlamydiota bacterium]
MVRDRLTIVCSLLNEHGVDYVVAGAYASILHGLARTTKDVDIFIRKSHLNIEKALKALTQLPYHIASEIDVEKVLKSPVTIVGDDPRVDLLTALKTVDFEKAWRHKEMVTIEGVSIPFLSLGDLIRSKDTDRLQDQADRQFLLRLQKKRS